VLPACEGVCEPGTLGDMVDQGCNTLSEGLFMLDVRAPLSCATKVFSLECVSISVPTLVENLLGLLFLDRGDDCVGGTRFPVRKRLSLDCLGWERRL